MRRPLTVLLLLAAELVLVPAAPAQRPATTQFVGGDAMGYALGRQGYVKALALRAFPYAQTPVRDPGAAADVPRARCHAGDVPERGVQGRPTPDDPVFARDGARCGLELVGQYVGDGGHIGLAWSGACAYMTTNYAHYDPDYERRKGTVVIDAGDPARPRETTRLQTPAMVAPHESLKAANGLLAADQGGPMVLPQVPGLPFDAAPGPYFDVYDTRQDCRRPRLLSSTKLPNGSGHEGDFAPDGRTYYESTIENPPAPAIIAIGLDDPASPKSLAQWPSPVVTNVGFHGLQIQPGGRTAWLAGQGGEENGLVIADVSAIQQRLPGAMPKVIGKVAWHDSSITQVPVAGTVRGHRYAFVSDENGADRLPPVACAQGIAPFGFVHVVDVDDPAHPAVASRIRLQISDPAYCDRIPLLAQASGLSLSSHYCAVDNPRHTMALACSWVGAGIRVFDVHDIRRPRELAYYMPPPRPGVQRGSTMRPIVYPDPRVDVTLSPVRWRRDRGRMQLWFASAENGFQILRFRRGVYPPRRSS